MNNQTQLQYKIHEILSKKGFYRLSLSQLLNVLILLDMSEQRQAKFIQRNTIIGLLKVAQKNKVKLENYFLDQKYRSIPTDIQIFVSKIVSEVMDISIATPENPVAKSEIMEKAVYPFNPFNYMNYSPSLAYPQIPAPNTRINYPGSYIPYPNPPMYYYSMYGGMPPNPAINPKPINMQMPSTNEYLTHRQPQNKEIIQEREQQIEKSQNKVNKVEGSIPMKEEKLPKNAKQSKMAKQLMKLSTNQQKIGDQIKKDDKTRPKRQKKIKQIPAQKQEQNKLQQLKQPKSKRKSRRKEQQIKDIVPEQVPNVEKDLIQQKQQKDLIKKESKPKKNLKLKKILDKILGNNGEDKQQMPIINMEDQKIHQQRQLQRKQRQQEQQRLKQLKRIQEQKLLKSQKGCIDFFEIIKDHRRNKILQNQVQYEKRGNNRQQQVSLPELQLIYYNSISQFDHKAFPRQHSPQKHNPNSKTRSVSIQTDLNLITHRLKIKRKYNQHQEMIIQESYPQEENSFSDLNIVHSQMSKEQIQSIIQKNLNENHHLLQHEVHQDKQLCPLPPVNSLQQSLKADNAFNVEQLLGTGQAHFQNMELEEGMILIQPTKPLSVVSDLNACLCKGTIINSPWISCLICQEKYHCQCLIIKEETVSFFECPRCKIRLIDPFINPTKILGQIFASDLDNHAFKAVLDLTEFTHFMPLKNIERPNELQLRCIRIDYNSDQRTEISWPDETIVKINGLQIAKFYSLLKTSTLKRRKDAPIIITSSIHNFIDHDYEDYSKVSIQIQGRVLTQQQILKKRILNKGIYLIGVYYTQREKVQDLYTKFTSQIQSCNSDFVQSLMQLSGNDDIWLEKQIFRIQDPYTGQVMKFPVRGTLCRHAQCFDLKTYLIFMSGLKVRSWRCPICGRQAKKFILDHWIFQLIQRVTLVNAIPYEIVFMKEGNIILKVNNEKQDQSDEAPPEIKTKKIKKYRNEIKRQVAQGDGIKILRK